MYEKESLRPPGCSLILNQESCTERGGFLPHFGALSILLEQEKRSDDFRVLQLFSAYSED